MGKPETAESVRELNFRGEFEVCEIVERSIPAIQRQLEQNGEQISHLVYDVRIIGNIDQSLGLLERICVTVPGIKIIVVTEGLSTDSAFMKDILTLVPAEQIVSDHGAELKRVLNAMLCDAGLISEDNTSNNTPLLEEPPPVDEPPPAPPASTVEVIPPSQIDRETARSHLVLPKPRLRGRNATTIAVCGAGHRIGTTTQAMQLCLYVKAMGYKAAVIEMSVSSLTPYTQISDEVVLFDEKHFRIEGTDIYNDKTCILATKTKYDYLILDYGAFGELSEVADYLRNDILVAVCGAKPSEVDLVSDILRVDNGTIHYVFSLYRKETATISSNPCLPLMCAPTLQGGRLITSCIPATMNCTGTSPGSSRPKKQYRKKAASNGHLGGKENEKENRPYQTCHPDGGHPGRKASGTA